MGQTISPDTGAEEAARRRRPGIAIAAAVALVITLAGMAIGLWNPWNFLHLATLWHPIVGGLIVGGLIIVLLWTATTKEVVRVYGTAIIAVPAVLFVGLAFLFGGIPLDGGWRTEVENEANDVKVVVHTTGAFEPIYNYSLQADRGLASRREWIFSRTEFDAPPTFLGPSTVSFELGDADFVVEFDPHTLDVLSTDCINRESPGEPVSYCPTR